MIQGLNRIMDQFSLSDKTFSLAFEIMGFHYPLLLKLCIRECMFKGVMLA